MVITPSVSPWEERLHRMSEWTDRMIGFMADASEYGNYFEELSKTLSVYLDRSWSVCDAGCGIGQLTAGLSPYVKQVTGVDRSEAAIAHLKARLESEKLANAHAVCADFENLDGSVVFDAMIFNYFGKMEEILEIAEKHCLKRIIVVKKNYTKHRFSIGSNPIDEKSVDYVKNYLNRIGARYTTELFSAEFGQPFHSLEGAVDFFSIYSRDKDRSLINTENVEKRLVETGKSDFPYYLPHRRESIIFAIER